MNVIDGGDSHTLRTTYTEMPMRYHRRVAHRRDANSLRFFFLLARVVGGVDVDDVERLRAVQLDDRLPLGDGEVAHGLGHAHEGTGRQFLRLGRVELVARADQQRAL